MPNLSYKKKNNTMHKCTQCLRLTRFACWEHTRCQFPLSSVVLLFFLRKLWRREVGGVRNPLANDSWALGHVLNLDTNVGSFYSPSIICFMRLPNIGTGLASLYPLYIHLVHHMQELDVNAPWVIWQYEVVWRERKKNGWSERREWLKA